MFRLEHNDPTLTTLVIGDTFKYMNLRQGTSMMDVLNALYMHDHVRELIMAWDDEDSHLWWEDGPAGEAMIAILRDKPLINSIIISTSTYGLAGLENGCRIARN